MTMTIDKGQISRRGVLAGLGGLSFGLALGVDGLTLVSEADANVPAGVQEYNAWVRIAPNGAVTIFSAGSEMGQGTSTTLPMIVAEEMDADWSKVTIEMTGGDARLTATPLTIGRYADRRQPPTQLYFNDLRMAGAQVRKILLINAAEKWGVDAASLRTEPGFVVNPANGQRLSYGEIAGFAKIPSPLPAVDGKELKARKDWRLIGKGVPRRDTAQGQWHGPVRDRREAAGHGLCHRAARAGSHRLAGKLERCRHQENARRHRYGASAERHRGRRPVFRAGDGGAQGAQNRLEQRLGGAVRLRQGARGLREDP
jgi:CO/xanthine dehydrogenase Mo-binding subunit